MVSPLADSHGAVALEPLQAMQITLAEKRGWSSAKPSYILYSRYYPACPSVAMSGNVADQTASIASAAMRGAVVGAAG